MHSEPLRVLVVANSADSADSFTVLLGLWGHQVEATEDGCRAVALAAEFRPHAVILDLEVSGLCGCEVARRLRGDLGGTFLLAVSGYRDRCRDALAAGCDHFLIKPHRLPELAALLDSLPRT